MLAMDAEIDPDKRKAATFAWDGREWRGWNYFGFPSVTKPGLRLEQMDAAQKDLAWSLLAICLGSTAPFLISMRRGLRSSGTSRWSEMVRTPLSRAH